MTTPSPALLRRRLAVVLAFALAATACDQPATPNSDEAESEDPAADAPAEPADDEPADDARADEEQADEEQADEPAADAAEEPAGDEESELAAVDVTVTVDPSTGPAGEMATITVTGAPNAPVTLTIDGVGQVAGTTDANGVYTFDTSFTGDDGDRIPVEADVGIGADTRSGSAEYTIDNPETATACTADDITVQQFHETANLPPALMDTGALSAIIVDSAGSCSFPDGSFGVAITDVNGSGMIDDGDSFFIEPQPFVDGHADLGIERGGPYFLGVVPPGTDASGMVGMPFDGPVPTDGGWVLFAGTDVVVDVIVRSPDLPQPAVYDVDFGDALMRPIP